MDAQRGAALARQAAGSARRRTRAAAARARRAVGATAWTPGLLSIVVPMYDVEAYVDECVASLRQQHYGHVEILVVDDGSTDGSRAIVERHAAQDRRVRVVSRPNGGLSAARNTGVRAAVGEFLAFVDADDRVTPDAYSLSIDALRRSGSDFAVFFYRRLQGTTLTPSAPWIRALHAEERLAVDLAACPAAMVNAVAWSKVYRRGFYEDAGLSFPEGLLYEDQATSMRAFGRARSFDVLPHVGVEWRIREDRTSITQQHYEMRNIVAHNIAMETSLAELRAADRPDAAARRALQLLDHNMQFFKLNAVHRDPEYFEQLRHAVHFLLAQVSHDDYIAEVGAYQKLLDAMIDADLMEAAARFQEDVPHQAFRHRCVLREGQAVLDLGPAYAHLPADCFRLSRGETAARARVRVARWASPGRLHLEGWAVLENVDLADAAPHTEIVAVGRDDRRIELTTTVRADVWADVDNDHVYADLRNGGFVAELDTSRLPERGGPWRLEATVAAHGLRDTAPLLMWPWVEATMTAPTVDRAGRVVRLTSNRAGLVYLSTAQSPVLARSRRLAGDRAEVVLEAPGTRPGRVQLVPRCGGPTVGAAVAPDGDRWVATVRTAALAPEPTTYDVCFRAGDGTVHPVFDAEDALEPAVGPPGPAWFERSSAGGLTLRTGPRAQVVDVSVADEAATVSLVVSDDRAMVPVLVTPGGQDLPGTTTSVDGRLVARFPLTRTVWGRDGLTLPQGQYRVAVRLASGERLLATPARGLLEQLPAWVELSRMNVRVEVFEPRSPGVRLEVLPPLRGDELSERGRRVIREETLPAVADRHSAFFRTLYGEATNGNGLGVHEELRRRKAPLELLWSVQDHSVPIPEGGTPVIEGTRAWYAAIQQSRYHLVDVHQLDWFERPQGQSLVQTMHGYPYKVMGHAWWAKGGFPVRQVANFDRRAREWTHFVSPATYATPLLRQAFLDPALARPEILEIGYPRNDVLLRPEGEEIRARTRRLLGVAEGQTAVLYAPTFRDYLSADDMTAARVRFFDTDEALRLLPEDHVLLVRGHAFNARVASEREPNRARVVDVTDHPDVNDLILASDVAVLDYSSLRFDYVLVDKPMVFLVPDLEQYDRFRGGVIPFGPTAPGPHVRTTAEVASWLQDLDALSARYATARARFRSEYVDLEDGFAGARLVDAVFVPRGDAPAGM